jgi:hypothetical protein
MGGFPAAVVDRMYTVESRHMPELIYQGPDLGAAESAFEKAAV